MSTSVSFNGSSFTVPSTGEESWSGSDKVDGLLISLANNALSKAGGTFTIGAEIDFGGTAGLKSSYYKSRGSNVSTTGIVRLANTESISWRNAANSADIALSVDGSNNLTFNGSILVPGTIGSANTVLTSNGSAPVWASIVNANIDASAAVARTKLASGSASHVIINDGSGVLSSEATLAKSRGGAGADMSSVTFPTSGTIVTLDGTQVLTNKDIDGGTASNAKRITFPKDTLANITALTRKEGTVWYATDTDKLYKDDGTSLTEIGSGSGGSINYITNPDAESGTTGWATYADAAASTPVDGTGGAPTVTITRTTTSPLRGTGSFLITKDAANRQGEGVSYAFTVDSADKAKVLNISFDYEIASGTFVSGDSSDLRVWIYDVTNTVLIPVAPYTIQGGGSNQWSFKGVFQTASNSTSYRLIIHVATTSTSAWGFEFDNVVVGPQIQLMGSPITDWASYTPASTQGFGTVSSGEFYYRRVGDSIEIHGRFTAGTVAASEARISFPTGFTSDSTKMDSTLNCVGMAARSATGAESIQVLVEPSVTYFTFGDQASGTAGITKANGNVITTTGSEFSFFGKVPIVGWSSTVLMSNDTDTRVVAMRASGDPASASAGNPIIFPTADYDTHGAYNVSTGRYTVMVPGIYDIGGIIGNGSTTRGLNLYIDAVISIGLGNAVGSSNSAYYGSAKLNAGQIIDVRPDGTLDAQSNSTLSISRRSGPSAIAATETVSVRGARTSSQSITTGSLQTVVFNSATHDSHGMLNTSTGVITVPVSGRYLLGCVSAIASNATGSRTLRYRINGGSDVLIATMAATSATDNLLSATDTIKLLAGSTIEFRVSQDSGGSLNLTSDSYCHVTRVGNY